MKPQMKQLALALLSAAVLGLSACGGGSSSEPVASGGNGNTGGSGGSISAPQPAVLSGTAATGAALGNANVAITDSTGSSPCVETAITTTGLGGYSCTLLAGKTAPFFIVVTDPTGNTPALVSIQTTTPAAGQSLTVNVTPLTTAIVAQLSTDGNALSVVASKTVDAAALKQVTANVVAQLASVLTSLGVPAGYDPFSTAITAATGSSAGNTADLVLDVVRITTDPATGKAALSTVSDPTPIVLATAATSGAVVPAPSSGVSSLSQATQLLAANLNQCFAIPTAQRVLAKDTTISAANGGPEVESVAPACQNLAWSQDVNDPAKPNFLHNGYSDGQFFYSVLTSDSMTGAQFSVPEITAFYTAGSNSATYDTALLNIKYVDNAGNPGNLVTVARDYAGTSSATRPTTWWLAGNQAPVDVTVRLNIRRVEQKNPSNANTNRISTFQTGVQFRIAYDGPGSNRGGNLLNFARVSGPGLPGNGAPGTGLVYMRTSQAFTSNMDLLRKDGVIPTGTVYGCGGNAQAQSYDCPNFWLARTAGISGSDATTLATNQVNVTWAQANEGDVSKFVKGTRYKVELFYGSNIGTPDLTVTKTLTSDLVQATQAVNLPWNPPGTATLAALDPAGSLAGIRANNLLVDWTQNPAAQQIGAVQAVVDNNGSYGLTNFVAKGATSVVLTNSTVPAFTSSTGRNLLLVYRILDTSNKSAVYRYN